MNAGRVRVSTGFETPVVDEIGAAALEVAKLVGSTSQLWGVGTPKCASSKVVWRNGNRRALRRCASWLSSVIVSVAVVDMIRI